MVEKTATPPLTKSQENKETIKSVVVAITLALIFRTFAVEPFFIPSGSMKSTLLQGDYVFVTKFSYGYSRYSLPFGLPLIPGRILEEKPKRGDVIVFKLPSDNSTNYIKRLIGLPGDVIRIQDGDLYLNHKKVDKQRIANFLDKDSSGNVIEIPQYIETLPDGVSYRVLDQYENGVLDNTADFKVPEGHYFFLGDNRDNSQDSRVLDSVGFVPRVNLLGPASVIFFSSKDSILKFWNWGNVFRAERFFKSVDGAE